MIPISISHNLNRALEQQLADPGNLANLALPADDMGQLEALAVACRGHALEGYALALCIIRLHDAGDDSRALAALNAQIVAWHAEQPEGEQPPPSSGHAAKHGR